MAKYTVKYGQSIFDIATEVYGSVVAISNIMVDNPSITLNTVLNVGDQIDVYPTAATTYNQSTVSYFEGKSITNTDDLIRLETYLSGELYGEIETQSDFPEKYINDVMRYELGELKFNYSDAGSNLFVDGDNGTFEELNPSNWGITLVPYAPDTNGIGDSYYPNLVLSRNMGAFGYGCPNMDANVLYEIVTFDTPISVTSGEKYTITSEVYYVINGNEASQHDNANIAILPLGYDESELEIDWGFMSSEGNIGQALPTTFSVSFTANSSSVSLGLFHKVNNDVTASTGGSWNLDNIVFSSESAGKDAVNLSTNIEINSDSSMIQFSIKPDLFQDTIGEYVILDNSDAGDASKISLLRDGQTQGYRISVFDKDSTEIYEYPNVVQAGNDLNFMMSCEEAISGTSSTKYYEFTVNGDTSGQVDATDKIFNLNRIAGGKYSGTIESAYFNENTYSFEGTGKYVIKD